MVELYDNYDRLDLTLIDFRNLTVLHQGFLKSLVLRNLLDKFKEKNFVYRDFSSLYSSVQSLNDPTQIEGKEFIRCELEEFFNHQFSVSINTEDTETTFSLTSEELGSFDLSCNDVSDLIKLYNEGKKALDRPKEYLQEYYPMVYDPKLYREHIIGENIFIGALIVFLAPALFPFLSTPALLGTIISLTALSFGSRIWKNQSDKKQNEEYKDNFTSLYGQMHSKLSLPLEAENLQHPPGTFEKSTTRPVSFSSTTITSEVADRTKKPGA